jgi:hypothetical protein
MKNTVFWDLTRCGSCKNRRFGGTCSLRYQGGKNTPGTTLTVVTVRKEITMEPKRCVYALCVQCPTPSVGRLFPAVRHSLNHGGDQRIEVGMIVPPAIEPRFGTCHVHWETAFTEQNLRATTLNWNECISGSKALCGALPWCVIGIVSVCGALGTCKIWGFHGRDYEKCRLLGYKTPVRI